MDWKTGSIRFAGLVLFAALGFILYAIVTNILVMAGLTPSGDGSEGFGKDMTHKAMIVFMASLPIGLISLFIKDNWRWVPYLSPLYAPSLFAIVHTLTHQS